MNTRNSQKHTRIGIELVRRLYEKGKRIFTIADARKAAPSCGMSDDYVAEALHHLSNTGWLTRLKRGLYVISSSFPGMTPVHEFEIAMALVQPSAISHWSALHFHGMTEQVPQRIYITTTQAVPISRTMKTKNKTRRSFSSEINGILYEFIKIKAERFFGIKDFWVGEVKVAITNPERTLIDGLISPKHFGGWAEIYSAFESHISSLDLSKMIDYSLRLDVVIAKRLGWIMGRVGVDDNILQRLEVIPIKDYRVLDPTGPRKGTCNKRWMIQENFPKGMFK